MSRGCGKPADSVKTRSNRTISPSEDLMEHCNPQPRQDLPGRRSISLSLVLPAWSCQLLRRVRLGATG